MRLNARGSSALLGMTLILTCASPAALAYEAAGWHGTIRTGVTFQGEDSLPALRLDADGAAGEAAVAITVDLTGVGVASRQKKEGYELAISREINGWLLKAEGYGRVTWTANAADPDAGESDGMDQSRALGLDLSARDISYGQRPAIVEGGVKLRERTYPGRPGSDYRERGYVFRTGFRIEDSTETLLAQLDPTWMSGLTGWIKDSLRKGEDLPLPDWFLEAEFDTHEQWLAWLESATVTSDVTREPRPQRSYVTTVQREFTGRDYIRHVESDSEYSQDTVTITEQSGNGRTSVEYARSQRYYPAAPAETYLLQGLTFRTGRSGRGRASSGRWSAATWEAEASVDDKDYAANPASGYRQLGGELSQRFVNNAQPGRDLTWSAGARWKEYKDGDSQARASLDVAGSSRSGSRRGEWKVAYSQWRDWGHSAEAPEHRTLRGRLVQRWAAGRNLTVVASVAREWRSDSRRGLGWQEWERETVGELRMEWAF